MVRSKTDQITVMGREKGPGVAESIWRRALSDVTVDRQANIKHAIISGNAEWRLHVAEIADRVACHVHRDGEELYEIVAGAGILFYAKIEELPSGMVVSRVSSLPVKAGDVFAVPSGFAHQLVNSRKEMLIIIFACPDSHLGDDRFILPGIAAEI